MIKPLISIVIPAFNEENYLSGCLDSLQKQKTKISYEVIVVDNASTDETSKIARSYKVNVVYESRIGRSYARQAGFEQAQGKYVLGTEADCIVPPEWMERLYRVLDQGKYLGVTGPGKINELSLIKQWCLNFGQPLCCKIHNLLFGYYFFDGFNFGITKEAFQRVGGFNTSFTTFDEIELASRLARIGKICFLSDMVVTVSARRFKNGFIKGVNEYLKDQYLFHTNNKPRFTDYKPS